MREATMLYFVAIQIGQLKPRCCSEQALEYNSFHGNSPLVAIDI